MAVKTNVEYHAVQKEIAFAQTEIKTLEDKVLERMLEADELTAALKKAEADLAAEQKAVDADRKAMTAEHAELQAVGRSHRRRSARRWSRRSTSSCSRCSSRSRASATASPSPRRATASAPSATSGCGRRSSTPFAATTRSSSATLQPHPVLRRRAGRRGDAGRVAPAGIVTLDAAQGRPTLAPDRCRSSRSGPVVAYIDGGARGNPGRPATASASSDADGTLVEEFGESIGVATNNVAEYRGLLAALEWARAHGHRAAARALRLAAAGAADARQLQGEAPGPAAAARQGAAARARARPRHLRARPPREERPRRSAREHGYGRRVAKAGASIEPRARCAASGRRACRRGDTSRAAPGGWPCTGRRDGSDRPARRPPPADRAPTPSRRSTSGPARAPRERTSARAASSEKPALLESLAHLVADLVARGADRRADRGDEIGRPAAERLARAPAP